MILSQATHYPKPEQERQLIQIMLTFGAVLGRQPGLIVANAFRDPQAGTIVAISVWESPAAMQAAAPAVQAALSGVAFDDLERRPRELRILASVEADA